MPSFSTLALRAVGLAALAATAVNALVITAPTVTTIWDTTGANPNYILWQLYPLTFPTPATPFVNVWIRNAVGAMYLPPLNMTIAENVDTSTATFLQVTDAEKFATGPGYQLFFADPTNPDNVYCQSDVFSIGTPDVGSSPVSPPASSDFASSTSSAASTATATDSSTTTQVVTTTASASSTDGQIVAATVPGGPAEQGFNLVPNGASGLASTAAGVITAAGAAALMLAA
ncbi:hypothetical protein JCM10207_008481 [Rhodosporidiobolus poonsookiae]